MSCRCPAGYAARFHDEVRLRLVESDDRMLHSSARVRHSTCARFFVAEPLVGERIAADIRENKQPRFVRRQKARATNQNETPGEPFQHDTHHGRSGRDRCVRNQLIPRPFISAFASTRIHFVDTGRDKYPGTALWEIFIERGHDVGLSTSSPNCEALSDPNSVTAVFHRSGGDFCDNSGRCIVRAEQQRSDPSRSSSNWSIIILSRS